MPTKEDVATTNWPDGTKLVLLTVDGREDAWRVIVRDDYSASDWDAYPDEHWFDGFDGGKPRSLGTWLKDATAVYALGAKLAEF